MVLDSEELLALGLAGLPRELHSLGWARRLSLECFPDENVAGLCVRDVGADGNCSEKELHSLTPRAVLDCLGCRQGTRLSFSSPFQVLFIATG